MNLREELFKHKDEKYKNFQLSLIPNVNNIIGVRLPILRKIASELAKTPCWGKYKGDFYLEEAMVWGLIIGYAKIEPQKRIEILREFVPVINNWAVCDTVCSNLKFTKTNKTLVWNFIQPYLKSDKEYEIRFGVVMILNYYIEDDYIDRVLGILNGIKSDDYYAKMAQAWALSVCFAKQWDKTLKWFQNSNLSVWVYNKTIQKSCESFRISKKRKLILKSMKKASV